MWPILKFLLGDGRHGIRRNYAEICRIITVLLKYFKEMIVVLDHNFEYEVHTMNPQSSTVVFYVKREYERRIVDDRRLDQISSCDLQTSPANE